MTCMKSQLTLAIMENLLFSSCCSRRAGLVLLGRSFATPKKCTVKPSAMCLDEYTLFASPAALDLHLIMQCMVL